MTHALSYLSIYIPHITCNKLTKPVKNITNRVEYFARSDSTLLVTVITIFLTLDVSLYNTF